MSYKLLIEGYSRNETQTSYAAQLWGGGGGGGGGGGV